MEHSKKTNQLVEIKAGNTGYGLLVEHDGYVSADLTENNKKIIKEIFESKDNDEWYVPKPFVMDVVLQKFGIENANKRIYPEAILKREVAKYQRLIDERMALGECYKPDVLVLTEDGWRPLADIKEGDNILTLNTTTDEIEIQPVQRKIERDFSGNLIKIAGRSILDEVTPNHGYPLYDRNHKFKFFKTAQELMDEDNLSHYYIPTSLDSPSRGIYIDKRFINISETPYEGKVMCLEVENHTWYVMSNGKCHWTKNCNHPEHSEIDLGRIAFNVIECHWEGHTLVGKIEFNITEGFRRYGICSSLGDTAANLILNGYKVGVSSRGIGSVKSQLGKTIVDDDFELICWDVVASPSTPGAYIGTRENLQQYVESEEKGKNKSKLNEKIEKLSKLLS